MIRTRGMRHKLVSMHLLLLLIIPVIAVVSCNQAGAEQRDVTVKIVGPAVIGVNETVMYRLEIKGGPASTGANGTWSFRAYLKGENLTGAKPVEDNAATGNSQRSGNFSVNVSAPSIEQSVTLVVNCSSEREGKKESVERTMTIKVVKPVTINVRVYNVGKVDVKNVNVDFYVDERFIGTKKIDELKANSSVNVSINWTVATYTPGKHIAKIVIASGNNMLKFENGSNTIYVTFYIKEEVGISDTVWFIGIFILALLVTWFVIMLITKKGLRPKMEK